MGDSTKIKSTTKKPLLHFFALGLVVFGLKAWFEKPAASTDNPRRVEITSADLDWFRAIWKKRMGRDPTSGELRAQVDQFARERILAAEAERLSLDQDDPVVSRRLAQKMEFLFKEMAAGLQPTDEELNIFLQKHRSRYEIPGETTFEQALFQTDQRGQAGAEQALALFLDHPNLESDATMLPRLNENLSSVQIRGVFGADFAEAIARQKSGAWTGPVRSGYGLHAVLIHERTATILPSIEDIRERLVADWSSEKQTEIAEAAYMKTRGEYQVLVEGMPYTSDMK